MSIMRAATAAFKGSYGPEAPVADCQARISCVHRAVAGIASCRFLPVSRIRLSRASFLQGSGFQQELEAVRLLIFWPA